MGAAGNKNGGRPHETLVFNGPFWYTCGMLMNAAVASVHMAGIPDAKCTSLQNPLYP